MKLTVTRLDRGKYETVVTRDDGGSYHLKGVAHHFAIPHDLAHFLVEKTPNPHQGFCGNIADGAVFKSMSYLGGRRKPKAAERSDNLLKNNAPQLNEAEALVRIFNDTIEQGHDERSPVLHARLRERLAARRWRVAEARAREELGPPETGPCLRPGAGGFSKQ